jgi:hypothetical protein
MSAPRQSRIERAEAYRQANEKCALLILQNIARYGEGSLPAVWAELVLGPDREAMAPRWRMIA